MPHSQFYHHFGNNLHLHLHIRYCLHTIHNHTQVHHHHTNLDYPHNLVLVGILERKWVLAAMDLAQHLHNIKVSAHSIYYISASLATTKHPTSERTHH